MPETRANGIGIHYRFDGPDDRPVVLMSNSLGTRLEMWEPQIAALTGRYRVLRYDSRGHGRSDVPAGDYTIQQLAADAVGLLDALELERVHFVGLSKGGMVGQVLGARHADRLSSLTLAATACHMPARELWDGRVRTAREQGMAALVEQVLERWFTAAFRASGDPAVERVRAMILATPAEGYAGCCAAIRDMDLRDTLGSIRVPTLVVAGADDPATPPPMGREIATAVPGARFEVIENAAHLLNIEAADRFNRMLTGFLDQHV